MKKSIIILLIALIVPVTLFAGVLDLSIGVDAKYRPNVYETCYNLGLIGENKDTKEFTFKVTDVVPGFAADAKVMIFNANVTADLRNYYFTEKSIDDANGGLDISGFAGAGLSFDIFFIRLGIGAGYQYKFGVEYDQDGVKGDGPYFKFKGVDSNDWKDFQNFKEAAVNLRLVADVAIGKMSVGAYVLVPTDISISSFDFAKIKDNYKNYIKNTEGGIRVMWHLF